MLNILEANKEQQKEAKRIKKEKKEAKELQEKIEENMSKESSGLELFKSLDGVEIGDGEENEEGVKTYDPEQIKAGNWTYEEYKKKNDDEQESLEIWFNLHPEVLKKCDSSLQVYINTPFNDSRYIDSLIDYIGPCISGDGRAKNESAILTFDDYLFESISEDDEEYELSDEDKEEIDAELEEIKINYDNLVKLIFGKDRDEIKDEDLTPKVMEKIDYVKARCGDEDEDAVSKLMDLKKIRKRKCYIDFSEDNIDDSQFKVIKKLYSKKIAHIALVAIGKKVLKDKTFVKNSDNIVSIISKCVKSESKKQSISFMTYNLLKDAINELKDLRNHDYSTIEDKSDTEKGEK